MIIKLQEAIEQLRAEIANLEHQKHIGVSLQMQEQIDQDIEAKKAGIAELEQQIKEVEQADREKTKQDAMNSYIGILSDMFDALWPSETYRQLLGINVYEDMRANFYQLSQAYTGQALDEQHVANEKLLAEKDEKIGLLKNQGLELQKQIDEANSKVEQASMEINSLEQRVAEANEQVKKIASERDEAIEKFVKADNKATELLTQNDELTKKLEAALKSSAETKPSVKVTDLINTIKSKNDLAANDLIARWNERQKSDDVKIEVPDVPQVNPFRGEGGPNLAADTGDVEVLDAEKAVGASFPVTPNVPTIQTTGGIPVDEQPTDTAMEGPASKAWVMEQIAALEHRIRGEEETAA